MSIKIPRYSGFPPEIFEKGFAPQMSPSGFRLYIFLYRHSDRKSSLEFELTDKEITKQAGGSTRALTDARRNLSSLGLIQCQKAKGGAYTYTLCDPNTRQPYPGDPKEKKQYVGKKKDWATVQSPDTPVIKQPQQPAMLDSDFADTQYPLDESGRRVYFKVPDTPGGFSSTVTYKTPIGYDR